MHVISAHKTLCYPSLNSYSLILCPWLYYFVLLLGKWYYDKTNLFFFLWWRKIMTYIIHGWETPSVDWPASICLKLESSLCHILCVKNDPTYTSASEMSKQVVQIFGLRLPSETFPPFERQDTCERVLLYTYMHTHTCKHKNKHLGTHNQYRSVLFHSQTLSCIFQSVAIPRNSLKKVAIQKSYKKCI